MAEEVLYTQKEVDFLIQEAVYRAKKQAADFVRSIPTGDGENAEVLKQMFDMVGDKICPEEKEALSAIAKVVTGMSNAMKAKDNATGL